jgi:hypothetical protein
LIERAEVALIRAAEQEGVLIDYRGDTSAQALLGIELATAPRSGVGTSPEHAYDVAVSR